MLVLDRKKEKNFLRENIFCPVCAHIQAKSMESKAAFHDEQGVDAYHRMYSMHSLNSAWSTYLLALLCAFVFCFGVLFFVLFFLKTINYR